METTPARPLSVPAPRARPRLTTAALVALWALTGAAYGCVLPYLAVYAARQGLSLTQIGVVSAVGAAAAALLQPAIGRLVDRTGRRRGGTTGAVALGALGFAVLGHASTMPLITLCAAMGMAGFYGSRVVIVAATVDAVERAGRGAAMLARFRICPSFGYSVTAIGGGLLLGRISFATLFTAGALLFLCAGLCAIALPAPAARQATVEEPAAPTATFSARRLLATLALMALLFYLITSSADTYTPLLMRRLHGSLVEVGLTGTISAVAEIPLMIALGSLADRVPRATLLVLGMGVLPLRFVLYALVQAPLQLLAVQVLDGLTFSIYAIVGVTLLSSGTPREERAWALGVYSAAATIGPIAGPLLAGALAARVGLQAMFGLFALGAVAVPVAVAVGLWPLLTRRGALPNEQKA